MNISKSKEANTAKKEKNIINKDFLLNCLFNLIIISILLLTFFIYKEKSLYKILIIKQNKHKVRQLQEAEKNEIAILINRTISTIIINSTYLSSISQIIVNGNIQSEIEIDLNDSLNLIDEINNITIKFNKTLTSCEDMFNELNNIINIDFSNFDLSEVNSMERAFYGCSSLLSINLNNDKIQNKINMHSMFYGCTSLISLNLSNLKSTTMGYMLCNCSSLSKLNLNNFDTSEVGNMVYAFSNCSSLNSLDLSSFNTSLAKNFYYLFFNC